MARRSCLGMAALAAGGYAALSLRSIASAGRIMLAVLPSQNLTGDPEQEYLSDGLTEEVIAILGGIDSSRLGIIGRTSAMHYKNTTKRSDEIGRELGVGYLVATSLRRIGDRALITAQLIDAETQAQVWVNRYERDARDVVVLQREVAAAVARQTMESLGVPLRNLRSYTDRQPENSLALRAVSPRALPVGQGHDRGTAQGARSLSEGHRARPDRTRGPTAASPTPTHCSAATTSCRSASLTHWARAAALKALELDESLGEAHRSLAAIIADHYWEWGEVERHYRQAIALDPNDVTTLRFYSFYLAYTGRAVEAVPIAEEACRLDPVSPSARMNLGVVLDYGWASRRRRAAVRGDPGSGFEFQHGPRDARAGIRPPRNARARSRGSAEGTRAERQPVPTSSRSMATPWRGRGGGARRWRPSTISGGSRVRESPSPFLVALVYVGLEDTTVPSNGSRRPSRRAPGSCRC